MAYDPHFNNVPFDDEMNPPPWAAEFNRMPDTITPDTTWADVLEKELSPRRAIEDGRPAV